MNAVNFKDKQCERIRRQLDAYLSSELLVETTSDVLRHLETCESCSGELAARTRVRDALRRAAATYQPPPELRASLERQLRRMQPGVLGLSLRLRPLLALAAAVALVLALVATRQWIRIERGKQMVASVLALGVSDHVQCAIKGHNYPEVANPPDKLREKLGPQFAPLLEVLQEKLPGFEVLEAHICSPGGPRKFVHFITRGRGTILSVILTRKEGERILPLRALRSEAAGNINLYEAHLEGMNAVGFETAGYWGFVVSDLSPSTMLQLTERLAPPLKTAVDAGSERATRARLRLSSVTPTAIFRQLPSQARLASQVSAGWHSANNAFR